MKSVVYIALSIVCWFDRAQDACTYIGNSQGFTRAIILDHSGIFGAVACQTSRVRGIAVGLDEAYRGNLLDV
jgi:hypothetical protein